MSKTLEFTSKPFDKASPKSSVNAFTYWLKRFVSIDNSLLLEIDEKTSQFIAKSYNESHSVVKMSSLTFDQAGLVTKMSKEPKRIKIGIFNILRLIKIIDQFSGSEDFKMLIEYEEMIGNTANQFVGKRVYLINKTLKMNLDFHSLDIFNYISDQKFKSEIAKITPLGEFELTKSIIEKINTLCVLDNEYKAMRFEILDNELKVSGKAFELLIGSIKKPNKAIDVLKEQYYTVDLENYDVELGEDRIIFNSKDTDTICVVSMANVED